MLSQAAKDKLLNYSFPGNVRELKSIIDLAIVLCDDNLIKKEHLQLHPIDKQFNFLETEMTMRDYTKAIIQEYLKKYDNNVITVSKKLNIGRSTIYKLLKEDT